MPHQDGVLFTQGIRDTQQHLMDDSCALTVYGPEEYISLHFYDSASIEKLVAALQKLGNDFAAVQPDPAVVPVGADPEFDALIKAARRRCPWPVAEGADTTGWTDSQKLGEQPPPTDVLPPQEEWRVDQMPTNAPADLGGES